MKTQVAVNDQQKRLDNFVEKVRQKNKERLQRIDVMTKKTIQERFKEAVTQTISNVV